MKEIIEVYKMSEIDAKKRASIIIKLGTALNHQFGMNWTEAIVFELVSLLDSKNPILDEERYYNAK